MRLLESGLVEQKGGQNLCGLQAEKSKSSSKKSKKGKKKLMPSVVQKLFLTCRDIFSKGDGAGWVPSPEDIARLRAVLDGMKPEHVGVSKDIPYFKLLKNDGSPPVTYLHVYECDKFSIGIFCLPPSAVIPLHNHPGMTVFSKLLFGSMHIKSYDWATDTSNGTKDDVNHSNLQPPATRLAKLKTDSDFTAPCDTSILYPTEGGNMHCFTALTSCAVLDVLGPPYSDDEGRHCTYYRELPCASFSGDAGPVMGNANEEYAWLEEKEKPEDFFVFGAPYTGPKVADK